MWLGQRDLLYMYNISRPLCFVLRFTLLVGGGADDFSFFDCSSPFCFLLI